MPGAARSVLGAGRFGKLLPDLTLEALRQTLEETLANPVAARERAQAGREHFGRNFELAANAARLADWLRASVKRA
jgi:glycosyltransferase involved in cell wall biosynthesis